MSERTAVIYIYDGSFDGFLSAVFEAYEQKLPVSAIGAGNGIQPGFGDVIKEVATCSEKARRVEKGILSKIGGMAHHNIWTCFWSGQPDKDIILYRYIRAGFELGRKVYSHLTHPDVIQVVYIYRNVTWEAQHMRGFLRFSLMENGVYYAKIEPKNNLVPLLMPHFAERYHDMPFLIHDPNYRMVGVYDLSGWYLVEGEDITLPETGEGEDEFRRMWKMFCETIAVEGRTNPRQQMNMMPKRFWKNLTEMQPRP